MKLNCLIRDTQAARDIKAAIQLLVGERVTDGKSVRFPAIYSDLRNKGLEIDAESAGALYNELYGKYNDNSLSTEDEIAEFAGKDVVDAQKSITDTILYGPETKERQIGKLPPEKQVATMIATMFRDSVLGASKNVNSVMKQMEKLVATAAKTLLPKGETKPTASIADALNSFFGTEAVTFKTLSGGMNTLRTLHEAVKREVDNYLNTATDSLTDEEAQELMERWKGYVNQFMSSTYDIMLGKSDQNKLLNEALQQVQINGGPVVDVNGNVKWSLLMEEKDPKTISDAVKKLFRDGFKDKEGGNHVYTTEQAERIGDYFQKLYEDKLAAVKLQKMGNNRSKNKSAKNIISDFIKDRGFINLVKDKNGDLLLTNANWDAALKYMIQRVGDRAGIDVAVEKLREFLRKQNKFTDSQMNIIENDFRKIAAAKMLPGTDTPGSIQRLIALNDLNGGKAFDSSTQYALNKVVGVGNLDQKTIDQLQTLAQLAKNIISGNNVNGSSSPDGSINRGAYAFQALQQVQRRIQEIIRENKIDKALSQRIIKYVSDVMTSASTSLLINPGNFGENIVTGFASNIGESVLMAVTHPQLFTKMGGDFWTGFASHVSGGSANDVIAEQDITPDVQTGERLRFRSIAQEWKNKSWRAIPSVLFKSPAYVINIASRTFMNSFDAAFNSTILRKKISTTIYDSLRAQGMSSDEAIDAMNTALRLTDVQKGEINRLNNDIMKMMKDAGLHPTLADKEQNRRDLALSFFEDALGQATANNGQQMTPKQVREATKALIESAQLQTKILTGKRQIPVGGLLDVVNHVIYGVTTGLLAPQRILFNYQQKEEQSGNLRSAAFAQLGAEIWKNTIGRFAGGIANFMALSVTATPLGFLTAGSLALQAKRFRQEHPGATDITQAEPGEIRKYSELHNLMRSMVVRAAMGTIAIGGFIAKKLFWDDDDEDDTWVSNLMQTKSGRRFLQKYLPLGMNAAAAMVYEVNDKKLDTRFERLMEILANTTGTNYDRWSSFRSSLNRAKRGEDVGKAIGSYLNNSLPTVNINQAEQITKFGRVLKSAVDKEGISDVKRDEEISKAIYNETETWVDAILVNGAIDAFMRIADNDKKFNRYSKQ